MLLHLCFFFAIRPPLCFPPTCLCKLYFFVGYFALMTACSPPTCLWPENIPLTFFHTMFFTWVTRSAPLVRSNRALTLTVLPKKTATISNSGPWPLVTAFLSASIETLNLCLYFTALSLRSYFLLHR